MSVECLICGAPLRYFDNEIEMECELCHKKVHSNPLTNEPFALSNEMTSRALAAIAKVGGPRCCKRDSYLSILTAIDFVKEHFGVEMEKTVVKCEYSAQNNQCIGGRCPFGRGTSQLF